MVRKISKKILLLAPFMCLLFSCNSKNSGASGTSIKKSVSKVSLDTMKLKGNNIQVVISNNSEYGVEHKMGYNGISELFHIEQDSNVFVPSYAGFNLEHTFGGDSLPPYPFYEPRINEMFLKRISKTEVELFQEELPDSHTEVWTSYKLVEPHYIDITVKYKIHEMPFYRHNYAGLFWASYINSPSDPTINFYGKKRSELENRWIKVLSAEHGVNCTYMGVDDNFEMHTEENFTLSLTHNYSDYQFKFPFYYGRFHNMVFIQMFKLPSDGQILRFADSPIGGGNGNPAWDFFIINPNFELDKEYSFQVRLAYKKYLGQSDVLNEFNKWIKQ